MNRIVQLSGGVGSWLAARRIVDQNGPEGVTLLFADTLIEDEDLYRFLDDISRDLGVPITRIADGRTPWEVFRDSRFIGNSRIDPCSKLLKRQLLRRWIEEKFDPKETEIILGVDWSEKHRFDQAVSRWAPWKLVAPLCEPPFLTKKEMLVLLDERGIKRPRLYDLGFPHNNCGGFCIKAGISQFVHLLKVMPERYAEHEQQEEKLRNLLGDVSVLRDRRGNTVKPLSLKKLRERYEAGEKLPRFEWGGCGCALD